MFSEFSLMAELFLTAKSRVISSGSTTMTVDERFQKVGFDSRSGKELALGRVPVCSLQRISDGA